MTKAVDTLPTPDSLDELIAQLATLLHSYPCKDKGIGDVSTLAGFFVGLHSAPSPIRACYWFPTIFAEKTNLPQWSESEADVFIERLLLFYDFIHADLESSVEQNQHTPLFIERSVGEQTYLCAHDWCHGYDLARRHWQLNSMNLTALRELLAPLDIFVSDNGQSAIEELSLNEQQDLQQKIAPAVLKVYQLFRHSDQSD